MIYDDLKYNPVTDIAPVAEGLAIDLNVAVETGVVFDSGTIGEPNGIDDPSNVWGRVRDAFEAIDAQKRILNAGRINPSSSVTNVVNPSSASGEGV